VQNETKKLGALDVVERPRREVLGGGVAASQARDTLVATVCDDMVTYFRSQFDAVMSNFIHQRVIREKKQHTINTKRKSNRYARLSSGHLCVAYKINCK